MNDLSGASPPPGAGTNPDRRLILLRHAKAEVPSGGSDFARHLTGRGQRQSAEVGLGLRRTGLVPDLVLCSTAQRARQTWAVAAAQLGQAVPVEYSDDLYRAYVPELLDLIRQVDPAVVTLAVVGHEPTMSATAFRLAGLGSDPPARARVNAGLPTAAYALVTSPVDWSEWAPGRTRLAQVIAPGN